MRAQRSGSVYVDFLFQLSDRRPHSMPQTPATPPVDPLNESEDLLDQMFSDAPSFMTILSVPEYRYLKSNEQHCKLIQKWDVVGKTVMEVVPEVAAQGFIGILDELVRTGRPYFGLEVPITYLQDGKSRTEYIDLVYKPIRNKRGEIYAITAHGNIVTEKVASRKAVENERANFRNLFKQTPEMVCILAGPNHVFEFVNEAHIRALGFDATGMSVREAQPESVEVFEILDTVYKTGKTAELNEIPVTLTDRVRYFNLTYSARFDEKKNVSGIMILGVEVTEQVNTREELKRAVRARDEFMSICSHELKTPLTSLKLQSQIRARALKDGQSQKFSRENLPNLLREDDRQIDRLTRLVDDMLDIARIQTGKLILNIETFELRPMILEFLNQFPFQDEIARDQVSLELGPDLSVKWDRFRVEQVLGNLLSNAFKYGDGKPIRMAISVKNDQVTIAVKDHGLGIAPEDQARIFDQFERAASSTSIGGLGLGLFISKTIAESHGGTIGVQSASGQGSTFELQLPIDASFSELRSKK